MDVLKLEDYCRCLECGRMVLKETSVKVSFTGDEDPGQVVWSGEWVCAHCSRKYLPDEE